MRAINAFIAVVFFSALLTGCYTTGSTEQSGTSSTYGNASYGSKTTKEEVNKTVTVTIKNFAFEPATITIAAGDTVVFVNEDGAPHTATASNGTFDTGNLSTGESGSISVIDAGTYEYFCAIHPAMKGTVVVE